MWLREVDQNLFHWIHVGWRQPWLDALMVAITITGLGSIQVLASLPLLRWRSLRPMVWMVLGSWALVGTASSLIKRFQPRMRPSNLEVADALREFDPRPVRIDGVWQLEAWHDAPRLGSFPSGHTTTSFAVATCAFLWTRGTRLAWVGWAMYLWATLVGLSRIYVGAHWPTDVLGGMLLGMAGGAILFAVLGPKEKS